MKRTITLIFLTFALLYSAKTVSALDNSNKTADIVDLSPLMLYSSNYILINQESGAVLAQKNAQTPAHPASITKALTLITAIEMMEAENIPLNEKYTIPKEVIDGVDPIASTAGFDVEETVTLEDILYGINLPSGADATRAISMRLTGDPEGLTSTMNAMAKKIGMTKSNFQNTSGLDDPKHLSTAQDLATMIRYALNNKTFKEIYTTPTYTTSPTHQHPEGIDLKNIALTTAHTLNATEITGAKSGYTELSERSLSSYATKDGINLIFVSTNAPNEATESTHIRDAISVYQQAFANLKKVVAIPKGQVIGDIPILNAKNDFSVSLPDDIAVLVPKNANAEDIKVNLTPKAETFTAPLEAKQTLGTVSVSYQNNELYTTSVTNPDEIGVRFTKIVQNFITSTGQILLMVIVIVTILIIIIREINRRRLRKRRRLMRQRQMRQRQTQQRKTVRQIRHGELK